MFNDMSATTIVATNLAHSGATSFVMRVVLLLSAEIMECASFIRSMNALYKHEFVCKQIRRVLNACAARERRVSASRVLAFDGEVDAFGALRSVRTLTTRAAWTVGFFLALRGQKRANHGEHGRSRDRRREPKLPLIQRQRGELPREYAREVARDEARVVHHNAPAL